MCCPGSSFLWGLKEELDIPAVGDLGKVLLAMANVDEDFVRLLGYRFGREGTTLYNHPVRNVMLAALIDLKGSLYTSIIPHLIAPDVRKAGYGMMS